MENWLLDGWDVDTNAQFVIISAELFIMLMSSDRFYISSVNL